MPRNTREYQKRQCEQAAGALDRYIYHLHIMHERYKEAEHEFAERASQPGNEHLRDYAPNYERQKQVILQLTALAVELQRLTEQFNKELV